MKLRDDDSVIHGLLLKASLCEIVRDSIMYNRETYYRDSIMYSRETYYGQTKGQPLSLTQSEKKTDLASLLP